jgi:hypothetical protein
MESPVGMARFAPLVEPKGAMFTARKRAGVAGDPAVEGLSEGEIYSG